MGSSNIDVSRVYISMGIQVGKPDAVSRRFRGEWRKGYREAMAWRRLAVHDGDLRREGRPPVSYIMRLVSPVESG